MSKTVYILLQSLEGRFKMMYDIMGYGIYNHASLGLGDDLSEFYSFRTKWGFCVEHPFEFTKTHKQMIQCRLYEVKVTAEVFRMMQEWIERLKRNSQDYYYSYLSLVLGFMGIRHTLSHGYFCSRFVAEMLQQTKALQLSKDGSIYMPHDFEKESLQLCFEGRAKDIHCIH